MKRIVFAFPYIGKSELAKKNPKKYIDFLHEVEYQLDEEENNYQEEFENFLDNLKDENKIILAPCQTPFRKVAQDRKIEYIVIYPSLDLKEEYLRRATEAGDENWLKNNFDDLFASADSDEVGMKITLNNKEDTLSTFFEKTTLQILK